MPIDGVKDLDGLSLRHRTVATPQDGCHGWKYGRNLAGPRCMANIGERCCKKTELKSKEHLYWNGQNLFEHQLWGFICESGCRDVHARRT